MISELTKSILSAAKIGKRNPKFCGYYHTPAGVFASSYLAASANNISQKSVWMRCKAKSKRWKYHGWWWQPVGAQSEGSKYYF